MKIVVVCSRCLLLLPFPGELLSASEVFGAAGSWWDPAWSQLYHHGRGRQIVNCPPFLIHVDRQER